MVYFVVPEVDVRYLTVYEDPETGIVFQNWMFKFSVEAQVYVNGRNSGLSDEEAYEKATGRSLKDGG